jgi:lysophospholipase L1-like esterase
MIEIKKKNIKKPYFKTWLFTLIIIFFISSIIIFFTEFYLKSIGLGQTPSYDKDFLYGYSLKPNQDLKRINEARVKINSMGVRSSYENIENLDVITFFGDSVTYGGSYIDNNQLFSEKVCKNLNKKKMKFFCANAGVNAYSISNMVYRARYDERLKTDIYVFLVITGDFIREYRNSDTAHFYLNRNNGFFSAIKEALNFLITKHDLKKKLGKKIINSPEEKNRLENSEKNLVNFNIQLLNDEVKRLTKNNKKVLIFYWPDKYKKIKNEMLEDKILNQVIGIKNLSNYGKIYDDFYYDGIHLSDKGHDFVGKIISKHIN